MSLGYKRVGLINKRLKQHLAKHIVGRTGKDCSHVNRVCFTLRVDKEKERERQNIKGQRRLKQEKKKSGQKDKGHQH